MREHPGYYLHAPGQLSRWGVVDVGLKCMHSCRFCYYSYLDNTEDQFSGMRKADFRSTSDLKLLVKSLKDNGFLGFDVTGGEPTLHPGIVEIIRYATELGLASRVITLGQYLGRKMHKSQNILLDDLLAAGLTNFLFSAHSVEEETFKSITGESWAKQQAAMSALDARGFDYCSNTTVFEDNYKQLPAIATEILKHNIYLHNFILMNAYYQWSDAGGAAPVQARYKDVYPYLKEAVEILDAAGVGVNIRYAPMCSVSGLEKHVVGIVGVRHDPYEWMNAIEHSSLDAEGASHTPHADPVAAGRRIPMGPSQPAPGARLLGARGKAGEYEIVAVRGEPGNIAKVFPRTPCGECKAIATCDGIDGRYAERNGVDEFAAYAYPRGGLLDGRRVGYKAPFFVKLRPEARMKDIVRKSIMSEPLKENPKVLVVVTCYNQGQYLARCLDSVNAQTYGGAYDLQVVLVDDVSTDGTVRVAQTRLGMGIYHRLLKNSGQPAIARNEGIGNYAATPGSPSPADLIVCLDADDWLEPTYVEECVNALKAHPEASIAFTQTQCFGTSDEIWRPKFDYGQLLFGNQFSYCSMYKREVWEAVGGYATNVRGMEDYCFWVSAAGLGYLAVGVDKPLFHYRRNKEGIFEQDVVPNFQPKFWQLVLNNKELYPVEVVEQAERGLEGKAA